MVTKGQKANKLYRLIGNIVVGGAVVITPAVYNSDDTKL
jgi:hypothetical protein